MPKQLQFVLKVHFSGPTQIVQFLLGLIKKIASKFTTFIIIMQLFGEQICRSRLLEIGVVRVQNPKGRATSTSNKFYLINTL